MYCGDETGSFVGDVGSNSCRFGYGGEDSPSSVFSSCMFTDGTIPITLNQPPPRMKQNSSLHQELIPIYQPFPSLAHESSCNPDAYLLQDGVIHSFDAWENAWLCALDQHHVWDSHKHNRGGGSVQSKIRARRTPLGRDQCLIHPLLAVDASYTHAEQPLDTMQDNNHNTNNNLLLARGKGHQDAITRKQRTTMTEILFESLQAPAAFIAPSPMLASFAHGRQTALDQVFLNRSCTNYSGSLLDTFLVVGAVILASLRVGELKLTNGDVTKVENEFELLTTGNSTIYGTILQQMFETVTNQVDSRNFATVAATLSSALLANCAIKFMLEKKAEFFRETGSGYNALSYFLAMNIYTSLEQGLQAICASLVSLWLRNSLCKWWMFVINFLILTWGAVSLALLIAIVIPPKHVILRATLMLGGSIVGLNYKDIYKTGNGAFAYICGMISPTRFFVEMMIVSEYRALGPQYGFTVDPKKGYGNLTRHDIMYTNQNLGLNDFPQDWSNLSELHPLPTIFEQTENGWYWGVAPALLAGFTIRILASITLNAFLYDISRLRFCP